MACPDCGPVDRRGFLKTAALGSVALAASAAARKFTGSSETLVANLYGSLSSKQKGKIAFPFDHPLRSKVDANWMITPFKISEFFTADQQGMIDEIFRGLHNPEFIDKVMYHVQEDAGGLGNYSVALFGTPGTGEVCNVFAISRRNMFLGRWMRHGGFWPDYKIRLFQRGCAQFENRHHDLHGDG